MSAASMSVTFRGTRVRASLPIHSTNQPTKGAVTMFGIGQAVKEMQNGKRVSRAGWNGKGMYLAYQPGYPDGIPINANTAKATGQPEGTVLKFLPYVMMRTAGGEFVPWLCSQTDLLAADWSVVE